MAQQGADDDTSHVDTSYSNTKSPRGLSSPGVQSTVSSQANVKILDTIEDIQTRRDQVLNRYQHFKEASYRKRLMLQDAQRYQLFRRDCDELKSWIQEKLNIAKDESYYQDKTNLQSKIQKHQVFEAEVFAHQQIVDDVIHRGNDMRGDGHYASAVIEEKIVDIRNKWEELLKHLKFRGERLQLTWKLVIFLRNCDDILAWINKKSEWVRSPEASGFSQSKNATGEFDEVSKKFEEFQKNMTNYQQKVAGANDEANQLVENGHPDEEEIRAKQDELNKAWQILRKLADDSEQRLAGAHVVQKFSRDADETIQWMKEKKKLLEDSDPEASGLTPTSDGKDLEATESDDLAHIQTLQRKHEGITRDLAAIDANVNQLVNRANDLKDSHPDNRDTIDAKIFELNATKDDLFGKADERKVKLTEKFDLMRFFNEYKELIMWVDEVKKSILTDEPANDVASAEAMLERHKEHLNDIKSRNDSFAEAAKTGERLLEFDHPYVESVKQKLVRLGAEKHELQNIWDEREKLYTERRDFQVFCRNTEQAETWMSKQEAFLSSTDVGDSLDSVEALVKKHSDFEKSLQAQEDKFRVLVLEGEELVAKNNFAADEISDLIEELQRRREVLLQKAEERKALLTESHHFHEFDRDCDETKAWINDKLRILKEDSLEDMSNLQAKQQKQTHIEAEIAPNESRVENIQDLAQKLVDSGHSAEAKIRQRRDELNELWKTLQDAVSARRDRLTQLEQAQSFEHQAQDVQSWLSDVSSQMKSEDIGKDLTQNKNLQRKLELLSNDIQARRPAVDAVIALVKQYQEEGHYDMQNMQRRADDIDDQYRALDVPLQHRRQHLLDAEAFHDLCRDVEDETDWIKEKLPLATSKHYGRDLIAAQNMSRKHNALMNEIEAREPRVKQVVDRGSEMIYANHFASDEIKKRLQDLKKVWEVLKDASKHRDQTLGDSTMAHQYFADANEAESWLREKEPLVMNVDYGKDEDSCEALLKKHEALVSDLQAFEATVQMLRTDADKCREKEHKPIDAGAAAALLNEKPLVVVQHDHTGTRQSELTIRKGEVYQVLNQNDKDWWKVETLPSEPTHRAGYLPATYVKVKQQPAQASESQVLYGDQKTSVGEKQKEIEKLYKSLMDKAQDREKKLEDATRGFQLIREAVEMETTLNDRAKTLSSMSTGGSLEDVEKHKKKFDDIEQEIVTRKKNVNEMQNAAFNLEQLGQPDAAKKIRYQVETITKTITEVEETRKKKAQALESTHEVQRFHRDASELEDWIREKEAALATDNIGHDLASVQALRRKHDGLERDLQALGEKIEESDRKADQLMKVHTDQSDEIYNHQIKLTEMWNVLTEKANARKDKLLSSYDYQRFLAEERDLLNWINHMQDLVTSEELAKDVTGAEALLERHQEHRTEIDARTNTFDGFERFGEELLAQRHFESDDVRKRMQNLNERRTQLEQAWINRRKQLDDCLELQLFNRDCEQAETWMKARETFLHGDNSDDGKDKSTVESLIKKHEDFDRAIKIQQEKIDGLVQQADSMVAKNHYDTATIVSRKQKLLQRWEKLKSDLMAYRAKLAEAKDLQGLLQDVDAFDIWLTDMIRKTGEEQFRDATNVQNKHQKHQVFQAEIAANSQRMKNIFNTGDKLINEKRCDGHEDAVSDKLKHLEQQWDVLINKSKEVEEKVSVAIRQQVYNAGVKDIEFWLGEQEELINRNEYGKDLASVQQLVNQHQMMQSDVDAHVDRIKDSAKQAEEMIKSGGTASASPEHIQRQQDSIQSRYANVCKLVKEHGDKLNESLTLYQFLRDIDDQEAWIKEKKLLVASNDYGKDLTSVENLKRKHGRLESELKAHAPAIENVQQLGAKLLSEANIPTANIKVRLEGLLSSWEELKAATKVRGEKLEQSLDFQKFVATLEEEEAWIQEKKRLLASEDYGENLAAVQSLLKKHDAFENDAKLRIDRFAKIKAAADELIANDNFNEDLIRLRVQKLEEVLAKLQDAVATRRKRLMDNSQFLQFMWKTNVVERWIADKENAMKTMVGQNDCRDLTSVQTLLTKQETFDSALKTFEQEGVQVIQDLHKKLMSADQSPGQAQTVQKRYEFVMNRWQKLLNESALRKKHLLDLQERYRQLDELFLTFGKKASAFNSWFDNAEEDLTDPVHCNSVEEIKALIEAHDLFKESLTEARKELSQLEELDRQIQAFNVTQNPYTWFTIANLRSTWDNLITIIRRRDDDLRNELTRQQNNDELRKQFAVHANDIHGWLSTTRTQMMEASGSLEEQLAFIAAKAEEIKSQQGKKNQLERLGAQLEQHMILDNRYTEQSTVSIAQAWDQLNQLAMRLQHNLDQQLQARNQSGVSELSLREFSMMFKYFDKQRTGWLTHQQFRSCVQALGIDVCLSDDDADFQAILDKVDPQRDGRVSLSDYMAFLINHETENVQNVAEIEQAFQMLTHDGRRPFITKQELYSNLTPEQVDYCTKHMRPFVDPEGKSPKDAFDYSEFTRRLFITNNGATATANGAKTSGQRASAVT